METSRRPSPTWFAQPTSARTRDRGRRLAAAAFIRGRMGGTPLDGVSGLLDEARRTDVDPTKSIRAALASAVLLLNGDGTVFTAHRLVSAALDAQSESLDARDEEVAQAAQTLLEVSNDAGRPELWATLEAVIEVHPAPPPLLRLLADILAGPARTAAAAADRLEAMLADQRSVVDGLDVIRMGVAPSTSTAWRRSGSPCSSWVRVPPSARDASADPPGIPRVPRRPMERRRTLDPPVAALPTATQLPEEPIEDVAVELAQRRRPERRPQVVPDDPLVPGARPGLDVERLEVAVE